MKSKARVADHSIHPMLVGFPIAFYTATLAALIAYLGNGESYWYRTALLANVIGVACALVAAVPGLIDLWALPARSAARRVGFEHASAQLFAIGLFATAAFVLGREWSTRSMVDGRYALDALIPIVFVAIGFITMIVGSALGRSLVQPIAREAVPRAIVTARFDAVGELDESDDRETYLDDMPTRPIAMSAAVRRSLIT